VAQQSHAGKSHPQWVSYTSDAYVPDPETEVEASTAAWLEEQAGMPFIRDVARRTFELLDLRPGESVLEVGCGTGVMLPSLVQAVEPEGSVTGLDHSAAFLARADRRLSDAGLDARVRLVRGDALALPFEDASFDATHEERVLMHLADPDGAIREMVRVTRSGGRVACAEVFAAGADIDHPDRELADLLGQALVEQFRNPLMGIELRRRLLQAGLENVTTVAVADVEVRMHPDEIDEFRRHAEEFAARGDVDRARAQAAIEHLVWANEAGVYTGLALIFVAVGTVPATRVSSANGVRAAS
jgi:ubiquinone/menaquinone biosynthesis C-methylase UbiE